MSNPDPPVWLVSAGHRVRGWVQITQQDIKGVTVSPPVFLNSYLAHCACFLFLQLLFINAVSNHSFFNFHLLFYFWLSWVFVAGRVFL